MKNLLLAFFTLMYFTSYSQSTFQSEADVLFYLTQKSPFTNERTGTTLTFTSMGSYLYVGQSQCYNPDVTLVSSTRAFVIYESLSNPGAKIQFIVDSKENLIMDRQDKSLYKANSYEEDIPKPAPKQTSKPAATSPARPNYVTISGETNIPNSFVGKFVQGNNYVIISKVSDKKGSITVSYNGKKYIAEFNPNNYMNANNLDFFNNDVNITVFGINNNSTTLKEIDLRLNFYGDNWNTDSHDYVKKIRFKRLQTVQKKIMKCRQANFNPN